MACHNLCTIRSPPKFYRSLLGLGLNFCIRPTRTTTRARIDAKSSSRFRRDIYTKIVFAHEDDIIEPNKLFIRSDWKPDPSTVPIESRARISQFITTFAAQFHGFKISSNLTPLQQSRLTLLESSDDFIVIPTDKNLGPAIIERSEYISRALKDHLLDVNTYRQLSKTEADERIDSVRSQIDNFIFVFNRQLSYGERTYLRRSLTSVKDPFAYFYILAKIHKNPWKTRPIVSVCGSITHGLARWIDKQLQPICRKLPSYLASSLELRQQLANAALGSDHARLFTFDAVSMYTNIDTEHALKVIAKFLRTSPLCSDISAEPIICGLGIIMRNNVFRFGDTFWLQRTGTAMGTPPGTSYATLYFGIHELEIYPRFSSSLVFCTRYIDDGFGVWIKNSDVSVDAEFFREFTEALNFGKLTWEVTDRTRSVNFLDLTLSIHAGRIKTCIYEKPENLYLYIPPHSAHPPGVLRGLVTGMVTRIIRLTSSQEDCEGSIRSFFRRLCARGYKPDKLRPLFYDAFAKASRVRPQLEDSIYDEERVFLHLSYHPGDPSSRVLQQVFRKTLLSPEKEPPLPTLRNFHGAHVGINRMVIAYSRPPNLRGLLFPRRLREVLDAPVSSFISAVEAPIET